MKYALVGNPNTGKTSIFNHLTGLRQRTGNFPGITVDKKSGILLHYPDCRVIDLPGLYDLYPDTADEAVVLSELIQQPYDGIIFIAEATHFERSLLLFSQLADLGLPMLMVINMMDEAEKMGYQFNIKSLQARLGIKILCTAAKSSKGIDQLRQAIAQHDFNIPNAFFRSHYQEMDTLENGYLVWVKSAFEGYLNAEASTGQQQMALDLVDKTHVLEDVQRRKDMIKGIVPQFVHKGSTSVQRNITDQIDQLAIHPIWGYLIFFGFLFIMFQAIFSWATWPMDLMDAGFSTLSNWVKMNLGEGILSSMLAEGIIPGIGGVVIFIPQIALLFLFIGLLESSGYMARAVFLMDRIMQRFGLNGKSVVPLISGLACAIPAIIATRSIENRKERLITILVTPFMTCSARLPVYAILITVAIPPTTLWGGINLQGVVLFGLYLLGVLLALVSASILSRFISSSRSTHMLLEMPVYRMPIWKNIAINILNKVKIFVFQAGKIIFVISLILWFLASFGPGDLSEKVALYEADLEQNTDLGREEIDDRVGAYRLEQSFAGRLGKTIEPVLRPLGYDWKISIALITSFAAREVFVGTLATINSLGDDDSEESIIESLRNERDLQTGKKRFDLATALSLLVFYAIAMQCMSTLAIVRRETKNWKWPLFQLLFMTVLAYLAALGVYQGMS